MPPNDHVDQTEEDRVTGLDVVEGVLTIRRHDGSESTYSIVDAFVGSLPTTDPEVVNALWNDDGTIMLSAGP